MLQALGRTEVGHVEERELRALRLSLFVRVLAQAEQQVVPYRVEVGREPEQLQLTSDRGLFRIRQVERVERVDLPERDHVALLAEEAHGEDPLAASEPAHPADFIQLLAEDRHEALALALLRVRAPRRLVGRRNPQHAVVLGEGELVQHEAAHLARRAVLGRLRIERELVDRRVAPGVHLLLRVAHRRVEPLLGRDEQAALRRIDRLRVGHQRVGVERLQPLVEADRQHAQHSRARSIGSAGARRRTRRPAAASACRGSGRAGRRRASRWTAACAGSPAAGRPRPAPASPRPRTRRATAKAAWRSRPAQPNRAAAPRRSSPRRSACSSASASPRRKRRSRRVVSRAQTAVGTAPAQTGPAAAAAEAPDRPSRSSARARGRRRRAADARSPSA